MPWLKPEPHRGERDGDHAEDDGARHLPRRKPGDDEEACNGEQRLRLREVAELDQGGRVRRHEAGVLQADQREEQADAGGDAELEIERYGVDQPFADRRDRDQQEQGAGEEHDAKRELPIAAELGHHGEGEIGVEPHAGGKRDGVVGVEPHDGGRERRGEAGGDEHRAMIHAGLLEDRRVDEHDVGHGEEVARPALSSVGTLEPRR